VRTGGGRQKGNGFERAVAKMVISAFAEFGITKKDCYRTPLSGGHMRASLNDPGDLVMSQKLLNYFPVSVECKAYRAVPWNKLLWPRKKKGVWDSWWKQACKAAYVQKRLPLVIFKQNGSVPYVMYVHHDLTTLGVGIISPNVTTKVRGDKVRVAILSQFLDQIVVAARGCKNCR
jgi:hypothetical protein